jgi:ribosomal protection tetracycline resistance protein
LNLGIVAHVDAGKTSLTERLLHTAGVIDTLGSVDDGSTSTDTLALERQRGITIKSAVVSFRIDGVTVNLIDTPGHPDFVAEVERVLGVLDGAVLVVSAVEGVQPQTRVLLRILRRLRIPTVVFVNKVDRRGARPAGVVRDMAERLAPVVSVDDPRLVDVLAEHDDTVLAAYVEDRPLPARALRRALVTQTRRAAVHPAFFGSAITGVGVPALVAGITEFLPAAGGDPGGPVSGTVFKIDRGPAGEKIAYVRLFSGTIRTRDTVRFGDPAGERTGAGKVTGIAVFDSGTAVRAPALVAGRIGRLWGLVDVRVGDTIVGDLMSTTPISAGARRVGAQFAPPTLETVVVPRRASERGALYSALSLLAEQDPLINVRSDQVRGEVSVSLYGEVQKEVIQATLADEFGVEVTFRETTTICVERLVGSGAAVEAIGENGNPFLATVGLRVEPAGVGSGLTFGLEVELGSMPYAFFRAVEDTVRETLHQGLHGWDIPDCIVTVTHSGYCPRQSHAHGTFDKSMSSTGGDFRSLTPLVLIDALRQAGTRVCEPVHRFRLELPSDTVGSVLPVLARLRAVPLAQATRGSVSTVDGDIPAARVRTLELRLPSLTRGEGVLESAFDRYEPVTGGTPRRPRTDHNPLNRKEYLLHVMRRV